MCAIGKDLLILTITLLTHYNCLRLNCLDLSSDRIRRRCCGKNRRLSEKNEWPSSITDKKIKTFDVLLFTSAPSRDFLTWRFAFRLTRTFLLFPRLLSWRHKQRLLLSDNWWCLVGNQSVINKIRTTLGKTSLRLLINSSAIKWSYFNDLPWGRGAREKSSHDYWF